MKLETTLEKLRLRLERQDALGLAATLALAALPALAALLLPPRGAIDDPAGAIYIPLGQGGIMEVKLLAVRWGYATALGVIAGLAIFVGRPSDARPLRQALSQHPAAPALALLSALYVWALLSMFFCGDALLSWSNDAAFFYPAALTLLVGWLVTLGFAPRGLSSRAFLAAFFATAGIVALGIVAQHFDINPFSWSYDMAMESVDERTSLISTLGNPEYIGGYLAAAAAAALTLSMGTARLDKNADDGESVNKRGKVGKSAWLRGAPLAVGLLCIIAMIATGTRSALIALTVGGVVGLASLRLPWRSLFRQRGLQAALAVAVVTLLLFSLPNPLNRRFAAYAGRLTSLVDLQSTSVSERILFHLGGLEIAREHPIFGVGPGMFGVALFPALGRLDARMPESGLRQIVARSPGQGAGEAHNDYLQFLVELGWPGLILVLGFVSALMVVLGSSASPLGENGARGRRGDASSLPAIRAGLAAMLTSALFSFPLQTPGRATLFWALAALGLSLVQPRGEPSGRDGR